MKFLFKFRQVFVALLVAFLTANVIAATAVSGSIINLSNGHTYYLLSASSWQDAEAAALTMDGNLVTINDAEEQAWVFNTFGSFGGTDRSLWIGLSRNGLSTSFQWVDGTTVSYTNWLPGQPDSNPLGPELYVHMIRTGNGFGAAPGYWNDLASPNAYYPEFNPIQGVVETSPVPEVPTYALMLPGMLAVFLASLGGRRNR